MEEGINVYDDLDDLDELEGYQDNLNTTTQDEEYQNDYSIEGNPQQSSSTQNTEDDFIESLLRMRGIEDKSSIKFEDDEGNQVNRNWDELDTETKLGILDSTQQNSETDLEDSEIELINAIRSSQLTPSEYLQLVEKRGVDRYIQNSQANSETYTIDQYDDDELFVMDLVSRTGITEEEAEEVLGRAKVNEEVFSKQIGAIRNEYRQIEADNLKQAQFEQKQQAQEQYNQFAESIANQIDEFNTFADYDLNMEVEDKQELYEFLTGFDAAGNNHFAKTLADPKLVVQMAWFALNGSRMIEDITDYYKNEITQVRKTSYAKGLEDARTGKRQNVVYKKQTKPSKPVQEDYFDDFDDFDDEF